MSAWTSARIWRAFFALGVLELLFFGCTSVSDIKEVDKQAHEIARWITSSDNELANEVVAALFFWVEFICCGVFGLSVAAHDFVAAVHAARRNATTRVTAVQYNGTQSW